MNATHKESWRPIPGYKDAYEVSDLGRVRSLDRVVVRSDGRRYRYAGKILQLNPVNGYALVHLGSQSGTKKVHQLVALTFVGPCPAEGMEVCHSNGDSADNRVENLRWDTHGNNLCDKTRHGTDIHAARTHCPRGHRLTSPNIVWRSDRPAHHRECRSCNNARAYVQNHPDADLTLEADRFYRRFAPTAEDS
jgi:hypothetical protein